MPLTQDELDKIRETEIVKNDIQKALRAPNRESKLSGFQQQIVLLVMGFALTGGIGGGLAAVWKHLEAANQRHYLEKQRALDRAYSLISQASKEVATAVAASDDVLVTYEPDEWNAKEIDERRNNWTKTSRDWRIKCQVLRAEIAPVFPDPVIREKFDEIINTRRQLGRAITNLPRGKKAIEADKNIDTEIKAAIALNNKIIDLLNDCIDRMTKQVNSAGE
jgi:hypothetical protein